MQESPPSEPALEDLSRLSLAQLGARVMLEQLSRIAAHEAGTRAGDDPEELHKMRVATRRLRAALQLFGKHLEEAGFTNPPTEQVKVVARALGGVRDIDVFAIWLKKQAKAFGNAGERDALLRLRKERLTRRQAARQEMIDVLDSPAMSALRDASGTDGQPSMHATLREIAFPATPVHVHKRARVDRAGKCIAYRALRKLRSRAKDLTAATSDELHEIRIAAKRFRYACEFLSPAFEAQMGPAIEAATDLQDTLGEVHDADVAIVSLLEDIQRLALDHETASDAAPVAKLVLGQFERRDASLLAFRDQWKQLPPKKWLKKSSASPGAVPATVDIAGQPNGNDVLATGEGTGL